MELCKFLNISADWVLFGTETIREISEDERKLLEQYRLLTERKKGALEDKLKTLLKEQEEENSTKQEIS